MQKQKTWLAGTAALTLLFAVTAALGLYAVDVSATKPHAPAVARGLRAVMEHSVRVRAEEVRKPSDLNLNDPELAARAFGHYSAACRTCHGAPGQKPDPWITIYPAAPDLTRAEVIRAWSDEELFWILKHGIKDTGMMALGPTHKDSDIWAVTAFVRQLPRMTAARYGELAQAHEARQHTDHDHHH